MALPKLACLRKNEKETVFDGHDESAPPILIGHLVPSCAKDETQLPLCATKCLFRTTAVESTDALIMHCALLARIYGTFGSDVMV